MEETEFQTTASYFNENWNSFQSELIKDGDCTKIHVVDIFACPVDNNIATNDDQHQKITIGNNKQLKEKWNDCRPEALINANPSEMFRVAIKTINISKLLFELVFFYTFSKANVLIFYSGTSRRESMIYHLYFWIRYRLIFL